MQAAIGRLDPCKSSPMKSAIDWSDSWSCPGFGKYKYPFIETYKSGTNPIVASIEKYFRFENE